MVGADARDVLVDGPWQHRFVAANGARFHVAEAGEGPLVVLLHGFPQMWWAWRAQLPALAGAGYRAAAVDLRGYGASDKPPRGYDLPTTAGDVAALVRALGEQQAVVVGHGWGGLLAWSLPAMQGRVVRGVGVLGAAHPLDLRRGLARPGGTTARQLRALAEVARYQLPVLPERRLRAGGEVTRLLQRWSRTPGVPDPDALARYELAMRLPFVAHSAMEQHRWAVRSLPRADGRRFAAAVDRTVEVPVLQVHGSADPRVLLATAARSRRRATRLTAVVLPGAGHLLPEERPDEVTQALVDWLPGLP